MIRMIFILLISAMMLSLNVYADEDDNTNHADKENTPKPCNLVCDDKYNACAGDIINLPEPRTIEEQQKLDECDKIKNDCLHDCAGQ